MLVVADASDKAAIEFDRLYDLFLEREPVRPKDLRWSPGDPVSHFWKGRQVWCDPVETEALRGKPMLKWKFVGTDEQRENSKTCLLIYPQEL
jgi:hypothetical protein